MTRPQLIKQNFQAGKPGHFVVEYPGYSGLVLAPLYDVERKLADKLGYVPGFGHVAEPENMFASSTVQRDNNETATPAKTDATAWQAELQKEQEVMELRQKGWGKVKIIEKVYGAKAGSNAAYKQAEAEYARILALLEG